MKKTIKDYTGESKFPAYIGLESIVEFDIDGKKFKCKLGSEFIIWEVGTRKHLHLDFGEELFNEIEKEFIKEKPPTK